jgi:hypothetical protein
MRKLA